MRSRLSRFGYKLLTENIINSDFQILDAFQESLIFVFASLGTKLYKDKVMGLTDQGAQAASPEVPSVILANWREVLNQGRLSEPTRAGSPVAGVRPQKSPSFRA